MGRFIGGLFSNESTIGRIMTALWIIIASSLLFSIFALPVITIGPGLVALHFVMLKRLHTDSALSPVPTFWEGFRQNLKQGIICWLLFLAVAGFLILDIRFCRYQGGILTWFKYGLYAIGFFVLMLWIHLMPVMAGCSIPGFSRIGQSRMAVMEMDLRCVFRRQDGCMTVWREHAKSRGGPQR